MSAIAAVTLPFATKPRALRSRAQVAGCGISVVTKVVIAAVVTGGRGVAEDSRQSSAAWVRRADQSAAFCFAYRGQNPVPGCVPRCVPAQCVLATGRRSGDSSRPWLPQLVPGLVGSLEW